MRKTSFSEPLDLECSFQGTKLPSQEELRRPPPPVYAGLLCALSLRSLAVGSQRHLGQALVGAPPPPPLCSFWDTLPSLQRVSASQICYSPNC